MSKPKNKKLRIDEHLKDPVAERNVLSCLLEYGEEVYYDLDSQIKDFFFFNPEHQIVYSAIGQLITKDGISKPSLAVILSKVNDIDSSATGRYSIADFLNILSINKVPKDQVKPSLTKVARLGLARALRSRLENSVKIINDINGEESILEIIAKAESPIAQFTQSLLSNDDTTELGDGVEEYVQHLTQEAGKQLGISSGYKIYDSFIGGGFRSPGIHITGARSKVGKSFMAINVANNVTDQDIPVLYLDTELTRPILWSRLLALNSELPIEYIERGEFKKNQVHNNNLLAVAKEIKNKKLFYHNISSRHHTEWISLMRRWVMKRVGFDENGNTKPCLIILDYIKLMNIEDVGNFAEYQYLGQVMTDLHNFCIQYNIAIFALIQLNRDGISKEDQSVIAGSDRILHLCSSFSILKNKTPEDYADENNGPNKGNKKLIVVATRFGPGNDDGEYINLHTDLSMSSIVEGNTSTANRKNYVELNGDERINI
jgi:replicative DNA helicase